MYCAPEQLPSPTNRTQENGDVPNLNVASASRSTDMYAFSMIAYEVLTRTKPFAGTKDITELAALVCGENGQRPDINLLPTDTPPAITSMIELCWSYDRTKRLPALKCLATIDQAWNIFSSNVFDIFLSHRWTEKYFVRHLYKVLHDRGYRVWYDENDMQHNLVKSMQDGIAKSKVVLICASPSYQTSINTMFELNHASNYVDPITNEKKPMVTVLLEKNVFSWGTDDLKDLCNVRGSMVSVY